MVMATAQTATAMNSASVGTCASADLPKVMSRFNFKVVPVDAAFTRGRWRCWDYADVEGGGVVVSTNDQVVIPSAPRPGRSTGGGGVAAPPLAAPQLQSVVTAEHKHLHFSAALNAINVATIVSAGDHDEETTSTTSTWSCANVSVSSCKQQQHHRHNNNNITPTQQRRHTNTPTQQHRNNNSTPTQYHDTSNSAHMLAQQLDVVLPAHVSEFSRSPSPPNSTSSPTSSSNRVPSFTIGDISCCGDNPVALPDGNIANIDGKIEQAMDLVKSHLMYAVREEIDVLRAKIVELERKVLRLETENLLLRECVPEEILAQLPPPSNQSSTSTTVNYSI